MGDPKNLEARAMHVTRLVLRVDAQGRLRLPEEPGEDLDLVVIPIASADGRKWVSPGEQPHAREE